MIIHNDNLTETAKVILELNHFARAEYTVDGLVAFMTGLAYRELRDGAGYCGTMGFILTAYTAPSGERAVLATVQPWLVAQFLKEKGITS